MTDSVYSLQKEAPEASQRALALAAGQIVRCLCPSSVPRSSQAPRLYATDCLHPESVSILVYPVPRYYEFELLITFTTLSRLKYALNSRETKAIVMQRLIKVDGKVRTDTTYPAGFMDVISIEKTGENFRLVYDTKGRFTVHRITAEEAEYKLAKVKRVQLGKGGIPFLVTHDART